MNLDKTFWGTTRLIFLGLLIDTELQMVFVPIDKIKKARNMIDAVLRNRKHKATLLQIQRICGFLNFLGKCVIPGRAFTRRLYTLTSTLESKLKPHHHLTVNAEMRRDLDMWKEFLNNPTVYCRPFMHCDEEMTSEEINFYMDSSGVIGMGSLCNNAWMVQMWDPTFIKQANPSIKYLELFALVAGVLS